MDRLDEWRLKSTKMDLNEDFYFDYEAEEMGLTDYQDPNELLATLKQKEEEVILAAQLGNALLLENRRLKEQSEKLHEQYADKLEVRLICCIYVVKRCWSTDKQGFNRRFSAKNACCAADVWNVMK